MSKNPKRQKWQPEFFPAGTVVEIAKKIFTGTRSQDSSQTVEPRFTAVVVDCRISTQRSLDHLFLRVHDGGVYKVINANMVTRIVRRGQGPMKYKFHRDAEDGGIEGFTELLVRSSVDNLPKPDPKRLYWVISPIFIMARCLPDCRDTRNHVLSWLRAADMLSKQTFVREERDSTLETFSTITATFKNTTVKSAKKKKIKRWLAQNFNRLLVSKEERKQKESQRDELMKKLSSPETAREHSNTWIAGSKADQGTTA